MTSTRSSFASTSSSSIQDSEPLLIKVSPSKSKKRRKHNPSAEGEDQSCFSCFRSSKIESDPHDSLRSYASAPKEKKPVEASSSDLNFLDAFCQRLRWSTRIAIFALIVLLIISVVCLVVWMFTRHAYQNAKFAQNEALFGSGSTAAGPMFIQLQAVYPHSNMIFNLTDSSIGVQNLELSESNSSLGLPFSYSISDFSAINDLDPFNQSFPLTYLPLGVGMISIVYTPSMATDTSPQPT